MGSQASRFMAQPSFVHPLRSGKAPSFLYLKNGIFYYRYRFPGWLIAHMGRTEIRFSLRTGHRPQALRLARDLHSRLQRALEMEDLPTHEELQRLLQHALDEVLNEPNKSLVAPDEIRRRLNGYLRFLLDADAQSDEGRPIAHELDQNGSVIASIGLDTAMLESAIEQQRQLNSFDGVEDWLPLSIMEMIAEQVFDRREIGHDNVMALAKSYMAMQVTFKRIQAARVSGDYGPEQAFYSAESTPYPRSTTVPAPVSTPIEKHPQPSLLLSELMERYSSTRLSDGAWKEHSVKDHLSRLQNILDILGDKDAASVTREEMRMVRDTLRKLPPSRKKSPKYRNKSIAELLAMPHAATISVKTVNIIVEAISGMYEWAIREQLLAINPAKGLSIRDPQPDVEKRDPLTPEDIKTVFFSGDYKPSAFTKPAYYWVPLIGLYTGMRLEEICQLHCEDIFQDPEGIWIFDIKESSNDGLNDKILKNKNSRRFVPIHNDLIELGLLRLREKLVGHRECRLFPELKKTPSSPKYGKQVGKTFSRRLEKKKIKGAKSFHSLRHSFSQFFKVRNLHNDMFRQIFGHEIAELAGRQYGERFSAKQCLSLISMINFQEQ